MVDEEKNGGTKITTTSNNDRNNDDGYTLKLKSEYVLTSRSSSLPPLPPPPPDTTTASDGKRSKRSKRKKGQNKKRPRDARLSDGEKMCSAVVRGETCPYGPDKCKYSHDLKQYLANRPPDIKEIEGGCPIWNLRGYCPFGVTCRVGECHLNMADGSSLKKEVSTTKGAVSEVRNVVSKDVVQQLRSHEYKFICPRACDAKKAAQEVKDKVTDNVSTPALEAKERKLIDFRDKVYVAPLTTVGNLPFRRVMKHFGADITCGEMALAQNLIQGQISEWALLKRHSSEDVFGVQIACGYADQYTRVSEVIENEVDVDFVDLNLGCPIDLICDKYSAGAAMMLRETKLRRSLEGICKSLSCSVTVKMRTGWDENKPIATGLVRKIQEWGIDGVSAVMVHGRSRLQRYQKLANWEYIHKVAASQSADLPRIPVIGNGDIFSYTDYYDKLSVSSNDDDSALSPTAMVGRGALIKPWLPTEIKEKRHWDISASERLDMLKQFVRFGLEHWGSDQQGVNNTRRFLLEWLSFLYRYIPVGLLEVVPQQMNMRPPQFMCGRNDLETLMLSKHCADWIKLSEMLLGPVPDGFQFQPKHKANGY